MDANTIIAIASVFTAFLSVLIAGLALWVSMQADKRNEEQARLSDMRNEKQAKLSNKRSEKHNRLSVLPLLKFDISAGVGQGRIRYRLALINYGVGPAIITDVKLFSDGELVPIEKNKGILPFILSITLNIIRNVRSNEARGIMQGDVLVAGGEIIFFDVECDSQDTSLNVLRKIGLLIKYESLYKEKFPLLQHGKVSNENPT